MNEKPQETLDNFNLLRDIRRKTFDNKFEAVFGLTQKRFDEDETLKDFKNHGVQFSKEALSNLLGGIGYYYGAVQIKSGNSKYYDSKSYYLHFQRLLGYLQDHLQDLDSQEASYGMKAST